MDATLDGWFYREIGKKIRSLRRKHHLSIEKLAGLCDMSANYLQEIETAKKHSSILYFHKIMSVLEVDYNEFFATIKLPTVRANNGHLSIAREKKLTIKSK